MACGSMGSTLQLAALLMLGGASALAAPASVGPDSLYVVGCGVMGQSVCLQWRAAYPDATIIGETGSDASHERLRAIGVEPVLRSARDGRACDHVLFCAPPSPFGDDEYGQEVAAAAAGCWAGAGGFVFASSGGVFAEDDGNVVTEGGATAATPRALKMLKAEAAAIGAGGAAARFAGLYSRARGAHSYWYAKGDVAASPSGLINLLHYDDAAGFAKRALEAKATGVLLAADGAPRTRTAIVDAVAGHPAFRDRPRPVFAATDEPPRRGPAGGGRIYDCAASATAVGWAPTYATIEAFFAADAEAPCEVADKK